YVIQPPCCVLSLRTPVVDSDTGPVPQIASRGVHGPENRVPNARSPEQPFVYPHQQRSRLNNWPHVPSPERLTSSISLSGRMLLPKLQIRRQPSSIGSSIPARTSLHAAPSLPARRTRHERASVPLPVVGLGPPADDRGRAQTSGGNWLASSSSVSA